jgi:selenocysteine lyase/cysteine desulfurase
MYALYQFAGSEGISPRFGAFLQKGFGTWPSAFRQGYHGLADWRGLAELKEVLGKLLCLPPGGKVLLAHRSAALVRLSARLLSRRCRRVLVTDLEWPGYLEILRQEQGRGGATLVPVPVRSAVLREHASADESASLIASQYHSLGCDGLFLTAVNNLGIRLPLSKVCEAIRRASPPGFVVIDGAQAYAHSPETLEVPYCDLFIAGCHKWLGAFHPMGLAFCAAAGASEASRDSPEELNRAGEWHDPLLAFVVGIEEGNLGSCSETVSLASLFSARAALEDMHAADRRATWENLRSNIEELAAAVVATGWRPLQPAPALRSGILLLEGERAEAKLADPTDLSSRFLEKGVALSAYRGGLLRVSAPRRPWGPGELDTLRNVLKAAA